MGNWLYDYESWLYRNWYPFRAVSPFVGYDQTRNTIESNKVQVDYNQYLARGYKRQLDDWNKHVGSQGKTIRYPELSYAGGIARTSAGISSLDYSSDTAYSNLYGRTLYGSNGLYNVASRVSRFI